MPTIFTQYIINYGVRSGWVISVGLISAWSVIILFTLLCCIPKKAIYTTRRVDLEIFTKSDPNLTIVDWGDVDGSLKQVLHASVYAICVAETVDPKPPRNVKFTRYNRASSWTTCGKVTVLVITFMFLAGLTTMFIEAFFQKSTYVIAVLWCLLSIISIIPASLLISVFFYSSSVSVFTSVEVTTVENGESRVQTFDIVSTCYEREMTGQLVSSKVTATNLPQA